MGAMYVSASRTGMGVALKAPAMLRRQFCITESLLVDVFDFLTSLCICHTVDPYVRPDALRRCKLALLW